MKEMAVTSVGVSLGLRVGEGNRVSKPKAPNLHLSGDWPLIGLVVLWNWDQTRGCSTTKLPALFILRQDHAKLPSLASNL